MAPSIEIRPVEYEYDVLSNIKPDSPQVNDLKVSDVRYESPERNVIGKALFNHINKIDPDTCEPGQEDSFFVADLGQIKKAVNYWKSKLPQVLPHYAVKCNNDREVVKLLAAEQVNFDCASKTEIEFVLGLGVSPERIVYANPCKTNSYIRYAKEHQVNLTTVDNVDELYKMKKFHPDCGILIRIVTDDSTAQCRLSTKFGCSVESALNELLPLACKLQLDVKGVAFHVGSGAKDYQSIYTAIRDSRVIFNKAINEYGFSFDTLDIGGGFEQESFEETSSMVNYSLSEFFPQDYLTRYGIKLIAEPGRFIVANAFTLAANVIAKRDLTGLEDMDAMIYINDGVYGNLNCILFDHQHPQPLLLTHEDCFVYDADTHEKGRYQYSIWGPTCDGLDCVSSKAGFSTPISVDDWLYFPNIGAYTSAASTSFNGFSNCAEVVYVDLTRDI